MPSPKRNSKKPLPAAAAKATPKKPIKKSVVRAKSKPAPKQKISEDIRLNKYIANAGICSRREADLYIQSGNVKVNGQPITEMGYRVLPGDVVSFDGRIITPEKKAYLLLNKPKNFSTTTDDDGLRNVMELIKGATKETLKPVGRMDKNTTGLLLFTNDQDLLLKFTQPNQRSFKIYQVSLDKNLKYDDLESLASGVTLDGHRLAIDEVAYIDNEPKSEIGIKLKTANVKVVRHIFEHLGYNVVKVDRVFFAGLTKKNLPRGKWRFLTEQEIINLRMQ